jgi:hypothetical protein
MAGGYMAGDTTKHVITVTNQGRSTRVVEEAEHATLGMRDFCLEAICSLAKSSNVKYGVCLTTNILVFLCSVASLSWPKKPADQASACDPRQAG